MIFIPWAYLFCGNENVTNDSWNIVYFLGRIFLLCGLLPDTAMIPQSHKCYVQENDSRAALTMETRNFSPCLSWAGAYVPSLFQHLLNHTTISGEGQNWRNILFKFNVSCKIDYYAEDPMSICIWTKECSCRIFFYWISFHSHRVFSFTPE